MRAWQRMLSGRRLNLLDPSPMDIEIEDIAHGLARVARWNGQTTGDYAFSVAQHCVLVERLLADANPGIERRWRLAALLHDAPEYVIGDMISPFKGAIGADYRTIEHALHAAIHIRFGLPPALPADVARLIKAADRTAAFSEAVDLAGFGEAEARKVLGYRRKVRSGPLAAEAPEVAKAAFLKRFAALSEPSLAPAGRS
jgi:5'-deoxynucleotidase YfbR-like HD superfamily hydrolase